MKSCQELLPPPSQMALYRRAERNVAAVNEEFLWLVANGLTQEDLRRNIERRPSLWQRFEGWLDKLPRREEAVQPSAAP